MKGSAYSFLFTSALTPASSSRKRGPKTNNPRPSDTQSYFPFKNIPIASIAKKVMYSFGKNISPGLLRSARNDVSGDVQRERKRDSSTTPGRHCEEQSSEAIHYKRFMSEGHKTSFKSPHLSFNTLFLLLLISTPLYAQGFDTLLNELSGSDADQLESEAREPGRDPDQPPPQPSSTEIISPPEEDEFAPQKNIVTNGVTLQGLDKQTARVFIIDAAIGQPVEFGTLKITVHHCEKTPLDDRQEAIAFVSVTEEKGKSNLQNLYSGWMFASSPALSALDHPVYDVWIKGCKQMK